MKINPAGTPRVSAVTRAKINLSLEIIRRRRDGFHEIETIFQTVDLSDRLEIDFNDRGVVQISCSDPDIPTDKTNLCHRAVVAMRPFAGESLGANIHIQKNIPAGSGMGGGSANAAGVLLAVNRYLKTNLPDKRLGAIAERLGSDVPFMLQGGTMLGRGKGEDLTRLADLKGGFITIVVPNISISTAWVYENYRFALTKHRQRINLKSVNALLARFPAVTASFRNALEDVVCPAYPVVSGILDELLSTQPCFASMTGSGSALYAIYSSEENARETAERFSVRGFYSSVTRPAKRAIDIFVD
jgi:4-diphosphocytidyl-2-C-methyl-D-erythritol kinase